jgi:acetate kinase
VFTAGIGEHSPAIRARACADLDCLGITIDSAKNAEAIGKEMCISTDDSRVPVWVVPTNEELVIALDAMKLAQAHRQTPWV